MRLAADGNVVAATDVIVPGQSGLLEIELGNDAYRFTCRIVGSDEDGTVVDLYPEAPLGGAVKGLR